MLYGIIIFYFMTTPLFVMCLSKFVESYPVLKDCNQKADAIILLGGGRWQTPEFESQPVQPSPLSLQRLHYAAYLYKKSKLPIIASGGQASDPNLSESHLYATLLKDLYNVENVYEENQSHNTWENALNVKKIADEHNIKTVYLVTNAFHMSRAVYIFKKAGLNVIPAPTGFFSKQTPKKIYKLFMPSGMAMMQSQLMLAEVVGQTAYKIRGQVY